MNYSEKLKDPRWQKRRLEILQRDNWACTFCGDKETSLHIHHTKYTGEPWEAPSEDLKTLCAHCHEILEIDTFDNYRVKKLVFGDGSVLYCMMDERGVGFVFKDPQLPNVVIPFAWDFPTAKVIFEFIQSFNK